MQHLSELANTPSQPRADHGTVRRPLKQGKTSQDPLHKWLGSSPSGAPSSREELADAARGFQRQGKTEKVLALGSREVIFFILPPQPLPITLHLRASDLPFRDGLSVMYLNKPLTRECKGHRVHKAHGEMSTSPPCCLGPVTGEAAGGRLGRLASPRVCVAYSTHYLILRTARRNTLTDWAFI